MKGTVITDSDHAFAHNARVEGLAFIYVGTWVKCALLPVICADFGLLRDSYAHFYHFEHLLPQNRTA